MENRIRCVKCGEEFIIKKNNQNIKCKNCSFEYECHENYIKYDFNSLLFQEYKKVFLLNKVLNNNAYLAYIDLKDSSLSMSYREDVKRFEKYIKDNTVGRRLLDIGCGPLDLPGYLEFTNKSQIEVYGLDPIENTKFKGFRVIGCAEFTPFQDNFFDIIIFATSIDHVCSVEKALRESKRILKENGKIIIWTGDTKIALSKKIKRKIKTFYKTLVFGYRVDKFIIYPNLNVYYVPNGAIDPFHTSFQGPEDLIKISKKINLTLDNIKYNNSNEVFMTLKKN